MYERHISGTVSGKMEVLKMGRTRTLSLRKKVSIKIDLLVSKFSAFIQTLLRSGPTDKYFFIVVQEVDISHILFCHYSVKMLKKARET